MKRVFDFATGDADEKTINSGGGQDLGAGEQESAITAAADALAAQVVRVEANFLRLPLFTLDNKHMRSMDGIRCEGTFRRGGKSYAFSFAVTRNTATYYPGPLARSAHFALLSMATEMGLPIHNPLTFTWRGLCARMQVQASGQMVAALRSALTATKGLMIESRAALFSKEADTPISTDDRTKIISLYDEVEFHGFARPDGSTADINAVWFSTWYLENLNALYSGPLDYALWRSLNEKSLIASRLYEFLFFKFYGGRDFLRFNYPTLVQFIPVRAERYLSLAKKQLQPAFDSLIAARILSKVQWIESSGGLPQLLLFRGPQLAGRSVTVEPVEIGDEDFTLDRIEDIPLPERQLVSAFHEAWGNSGFTPSKAELDLARVLLAKHGQEAMQELLPKAVKRLKLKWAGAKSFCAIDRYMPEIIDEWQRAKRRVHREQQEQQRHEESRKHAVQQAQDQAVLKALWEGLTPAEQEDIRACVLKRNPRSLKKHPTLVERFCLAELAIRNGIADGAIAA
jgi:hypothetical protein